MTRSRATAGWRTRVSTGVLYAILVGSLVVVLAPFLWVFAGAFRSTGEILANPGAWFPVNPTLDNFVTLVVDGNFLGYGVNSVVVATIIVVGNVIFASMVGYALAKLHFSGRRVVFGAILASMMIPFTAIFVPQFVVVARLGLIDTLAGIALPMLVLPLQVFIMRQYAESIPDELFEAARLDGAGEFRMFRVIFLPLAGPAIATQALLAFLASWNGFLWPLIVAQTTDRYTLPVALSAMSQGTETVDYGILLAGAIVVLLPVLILFLALQKYFIRGIATVGMK
ncbi:multiple sugar transport system permease protein [Microbacteriaceae bacterium SG_E_30_P1]|uniref:Multiple sugar transport system permease protein n=1 Tax=Antiquaquibacter oligotrophicus TaxID=2880260 RepID=A0ABT6KPD3_9MICO|nr:carbohydrate ABC transporter permease [Antiquaquibacter oligotrophicus]MDH6181661.1 multiple sugar transport system permease protein [Antiquaquibacter oligotrophicus]UDF12655.1 carbohydrate ABC transporter permease [Antiquaquibacter oligotrophicus]